LVDIGVTDFVPEFGHLPYVMGEGNKKLSKRDPQASLNSYRDSGYIPEGLVNYLALLGWSIADDRDIFSLPEMVSAFDIGDVNANPARFDAKKCEAINATHVRLLTVDDFAARLLRFLIDRGVLPSEPAESDREVVSAAAPLVQERVRTLGEAVEMLRFLFIDEAEFTVDQAAAAKSLDEAGRAIVASSVIALNDAPDWSAAAISAILHAELIERQGLKPRLAFTPLRVGVTGRQVSPPLFESMELLGRARSLRRLTDAAGRV
jgi:glutamyl-tRNA synthetase